MENFDLKKAKNFLLENTSTEDFIQSQGGTLEALKFETPDDVQTEIEKIRDEFDLVGDESIYDEAYFKFEEIYGINPMKLIRFLSK